MGKKQNKKMPHKNTTKGETVFPTVSPEVKEEVGGEPTNSSLPDTKKPYKPTYSMQSFEYVYVSKY